MKELLPSILMKTGMSQKEFSKLLNESFTTASGEELYFDKLLEEKL